MGNDLFASWFSNDLGVVWHYFQFSYFQKQIIILIFKIQTCLLWLAISKNINIMTVAEVVIVSGRDSIIYDDSGGGGTDDVVVMVIVAPMIVEKEMAALAVMVA